MKKNTVIISRFLEALLGVLTFVFVVSCNSNQNLKSDEIPEDSMSEFTSDLKKRTFQYFWDTIDTVNYQSADRYPSRTFTSIAATGFALPSYIIGIENGFVSRQEGANRILNMLRWLEQSKQGDSKSGATGYKGFYYHFLNYGSGTRFKDVELSTIDTALLMAGILTAQSYFDGENLIESEIREMSDFLFRRVEWDWAMNDAETMSMGWKPESGFIPARWNGYNEAMILVIMGMASPTHPIHDKAWDSWTSTYNWDEFYGYEHVNFGPLFGHQYSQMFIDFRGIKDTYMGEKGFDYFENSRRATLAQKAYAAANPQGFVGYSADIWGLTACDGPQNIRRSVNGKMVDFRTYSARGAAADYKEDDGTIAPTAAGGSIPFAPKETLTALFTMKEKYGSKLYREYGFIDAFNMTFQEEGWFNDDYIGIDQGPILIQLENYETGLIWDILKKNPYIVSGLKKASFSGGWIEELNNTKEG